MDQDPDKAYQTYDNIMDHKFSLQNVPWYIWDAATPYLQKCFLNLHKKTKLPKSNQKMVFIYPELIGSEHLLMFPRHCTFSFCPTLPHNQQAIKALIEKDAYNQFFKVVCNQYPFPLVVYLPEVYNVLLNSPTMSYAIFRKVILLYVGYFWVLEKENRRFIQRDFGEMKELLDCILENYSDFLLVDENNKTDVTVFYSHYLTIFPKEALELLPFFDVAIYNLQRNQSIEEAHILGFTEMDMKTILGGSDIGFRCESAFLPQFIGFNVTKPIYHMIDKTYINDEMNQNGDPKKKTKTE